MLQVPSPVYVEKVPLPAPVSPPQDEDDIDSDSPDSLEQQEGVANVGAAVDKQDSDPLVSDKADSVHVEPDQDADVLSAGVEDVPSKGTDDKLVPASTLFKDMARKDVEPEEADAMKISSVEEEDEAKELPSSAAQDLGKNP